MSAEILGADAFEKDAMLIELRHEYGEDVPYTTFYGWCQTLKIDSGLVFYGADDVLTLLTLIWARFQKGYRPLDRTTIHKLRKGYADARTNRKTRATRFKGNG